MPRPGIRWDLFCRVIDNWGDAGVCWRLAAELAALGESVRLWIDDPAPLDWMAPGGDRSGVEVLRWRDPLPGEAPGDVVIEAFACDPPAAFVKRMADSAAQGRPPVWINLEYLSAEPWAERTHGLPSPQLAGPGAGLTKWFFHPGFTPASGGLLRSRAPVADRDDTLALAGARARPGERVALLFHYDGAPLQALLAALADRPTLLLGAASPLADVLPTVAASVRVHPLPRLAQPLFDQLLRATDLNLVRGEDSFAQAQQTGIPFVWQIYPQHDGVHAAKLDAFLDRFLEGCPAPLAGSVRAFHRRWNGLGGGDEADGALHWPDAAGWRQACHDWRDALAAQTDLTTRLLGFVAQKG